MIQTAQLKKALLQLGYEPGNVHLDYRFAAVDIPQRPIQSVEVAAFLESPTSYKNAALAIVRATDDESAAPAVAARRSLGAPYLVVLTPRTAAAWTYTSNGPTRIQQVPIQEWETLFERPNTFTPQAVRQLKIVRLREGEPTTLSLFEPSILYAIQAEAQSALEALLLVFLSYFDSPARAPQLTLAADHRVLYPLVFRLLAAKILLDREDPRLGGVDADDALDVLNKIGTLYSLDGVALRWNDARRKQVAQAWRSLRDGLFVRNIAADDLAFVYENALITPEIRKALGTHSTPISVAEYVLRSFDLPVHNAGSLRVYEPFAGSCVFLTAALRRFRELLPTEWTPAQLHKHLVKQFRASELDPFACEIARLSLILADYPNNNGWKIDNEDLFRGGLLAQRVKDADLLICNPPFENFDQAVSGLSIHKPLALLDALTAAPPAYLGVVMPSGFSSQKLYRPTFDAIAKVYGDIEVLQVPEGAFRRASVGAEVLIAQKRRENTRHVTSVTVRSSVITRSDWNAFTHSLRPTTRSVVEVDTRVAPAVVGLRPLRSLWSELADAPLMESAAEFHRGLEWTVNQAKASRPKEQKGFRRGLHRIAGSLSQFRIGTTTFLDCRPSELRGGAINHPWNVPKVICNAIRTSRGPWRLAAAVDGSGLVVSQQFFGVWLRDAVHSNVSLLTIACVLNSPVANAFSYAHDPNKGLRVETMKRIPLPRKAVSSSLIELVREYIAFESTDGPLFGQGRKDATAILMEIDAVLLAAYDLPPKLERELLRFMGDGERSCDHPFPRYPGTAPDSGALPLAILLALRPDERQGAWQTLAQPLPSDVADVFDAA
jgi:hypothetical protein